MLLASPQAGLRLELREVICFHWPIAPAQISGGCANDCRTTAADLPSAESEIAVPHPLAVNCSGAWTSVSILPPAGSTVATPLSPSTSWPKRIFAPPGIQVSQLAEAFMPGVMFRASPPSAGTTKISPPTAGSSLMMPEMNATDLPSGDHAGTAICESIGGL